MQHKLLEQAIEDDNALLFEKNFADIHKESRTTREAELKELQDAAYTACKRGKLNIAKYLIEKKHVDPNLMLDNLCWSHDNGTLLKFAAESGNLDLVKYLIETHHVDIEAKGTYPGTQATALNHAAGQGHYHVVEYLLSKHANPNARSSCYDATILIDAILSNSLPTVKLLVEKGALILPIDLHFATEAGKTDIVRFLVKNGANPKEPYTDPLLELAAKSGKVDLFQYLENECGLQIFEPGTRTHEDIEHELLYAAAQGSAAMLHYLVDQRKLDLKKYVDIESEGEYAYYMHNAYRTILGKAASTHIDILRYLFEERKLIPGKNALTHLKDELLSAGIHVNTYIQSYLVDSRSEKDLLLTISRHGLDALDPPTLFKLYKSKFLTKGHYGDYDEEIRYHIEKRNFTHKQIDQIMKKNKELIMNLLSCYSNFSFQGNFEKLKYIVDQIPDINMTNEKGESVALLAAESSYNDIIKFLIERGVDVDQPNKEGYTLINLLDRSAAYHKAPISEILLHVKDYTNSLKGACKATFNNSNALETILKRSKGEIGHANVEDLILNISSTEKLSTLLTYVSQPVFEKMTAFLFSLEKMTSLLFSNKDAITSCIELAKANRRTDFKPLLNLSMLAAEKDQTSRAVAADADEKKVQMRNP